MMHFHIPRHIRVGKADFWRFVRFGITGCLAEGVHYGVYLLALLWLNPGVSYTIGYLVAMVFNYIMTTFFTFRRRPSGGNIAGFAASHALNYSLELGLLYAGMWLGLCEHWAGLVAMTVVVPINFLILRFVFIRKK